MKTLLLLFIFAFSAFAQDKPLSDSEQREHAALLATEKQNSDALTSALSDLLNTPTGAESVRLHGNYRTAWLALRLVQAERGLWLAKAQVKHGCVDCKVSEDGKSLVSP